ncbi:MAG TPA: AI-2E family transporter [Candidatus Binatus sp.]|nr:AI-2E family transporter [Candidatus Binatus sp.]
MNQTWLVTAFFFALLLVILYGAFLVLSPFLAAITWAVILAILVYPLYLWLIKILRGRTTLAGILVVVLIAVLVIAPGVELVWFLSDDAAALVQSVRALISGDGTADLNSNLWVQQIQSWWNMFSFSLIDFKINWKEIAVQAAQASSSMILTQAKSLAQNVLLFTVNFVIVLVTLFFLLRDGEDFCARIRRLLPMDHEHQERLFQNITNAVTAVVHGCLLVAMVQGFLAGLAFWLTGVPYSALWGVVTAFAALIPLGGTTLVTIPASIYLFIQGDNIRGIILLVWCLGVVVTIDNVLKPIFIGSRIQMPTIFLLFGILGGLAVFGALGLILGPVLFALLMALLDLYSEEYGATPEK